jgi:DNA replication protein DnaC
MGPKSIKSAINDIKTKRKEVVRIQYMPYSMNVAKRVWFDIAKNIIGKDIQRTPGIVDTWTELIKYAHGDNYCRYEITKSLCIMGRTGSGKSATMQILSEYLKIDNVFFERNGKKISFNFNIFSARKIASDFAENGYEGLEKYLIYSNICIDDFGSEPNESLHYGTRLNVIPEIIEERYSRGLTTHFTTNFDDELIKNEYNDRVHSRIIEQCNLIKLSDKDFRLTDKTLFE